MPKFRCSTTVASVSTPSLPIELQIERDAIIAEIHAAWRGVTREDGMDWVDAVLEDGIMEDATIARLRASDHGEDWAGLVDLDVWETDKNSTAMRFIDAGGYRYYLAPLMVRCLRAAGDVGVVGSLEYPASYPESAVERWSLLDGRQRACVARFLRCMDRLDRLEGDDWSRAWHVHWREFDDEAHR
jgi:uncharacterized protein (DUF736 family)